ncbi:hypothetical protein AB0P02_29760 [Streptomyces griseoluteus]
MAKLGSRAARTRSQVARLRELPSAAADFAGRATIRSSELVA